MEEADTLGHDHIGIGHLLLRLIRQHDGTAVRVLLDLNIDLGRLRAEALRYLEAPERGDQSAAAPDWRVAEAFPELTQLDTMIFKERVLSSWLMLILFLGIVAWAAYQCNSGP